MIGADAVPMRRPRLAGFSAVTQMVRLDMCAMGEDPSVRMRHVAAVLAFTSDVARDGQRMRIRFEHSETAVWVSDVLAHRDVELIEGSEETLVVIASPQTVLGRYGFRNGRWVFGQGMSAAVGISRGAIHAAGTLDKHGLRVACPSAAMMLTLTAVLARLGIAAKPTDGRPRVAVAAADVPAALERLGALAASRGYQRVRSTAVVVTG